MSRGRSAAVYAVAGLIAVGVGAGAAMWRSPTPSTSSVSLKVRPQEVSPDVVRERTVEALIEEARAVAEIERSPGFDVVLSMVGGGQPGVLDRLLEADVPPELRLALARALPRRGSGPETAAALLEPLLEAGSADAVAVLRARDEAEVVRDAGYRCTFGVYRGWAVAWGSGVAWAPVRDGDVWTLNARAIDGGSRGLALRLEGATTVTATSGDGPRIEATAID